MSAPAVWTGCGGRGPAPGPPARKSRTAWPGSRRHPGSAPRPGPRLARRRSASVPGSGMASRRSARRACPRAARAGRGPKRPRHMCSRPPSPARSARRRRRRRPSPGRAAPRPQRPRRPLQRCGRAAATGSAGSGSPSSGNTAAGGAVVGYARCMRAHGVSSFPEPGSLSAPDAIRNFKGEIVQAVGALASSPVFQAAQRACAEYYGRPTPARQQVSPQEMQKLLAVSRCMRAHGVPHFPDPNPTTGDMNPPADISRNSPTVIAALRACQPQARAAGLGPPSTGQ